MKSLPALFLVLVSIISEAMHSWKKYDPKQPLLKYCFISYFLFSLLSTRQKNDKKNVSFSMRKALIYFLDAR